MAQALCLQGPHRNGWALGEGRRGRQAGLQGEGGGFVPSFLGNPCSLTFSFTPHLFLSSPLLIIFLPYISNLLVANRTEFATDSWVTCFMDYFRSNPIKVNVSTVGKSL